MDEFERKWSVTEGVGLDKPGSVLTRATEARGLCILVSVVVSHKLHHVSTCFDMLGCGISHILVSSLHVLLLPAGHTLHHVSNMLRYIAAIHRHQSETRTVTKVSHGFYFER